MKQFRDLPSVTLDDRDYLPPMPGIYIAATIGHVLYVGRSTNMLKRWQSHHKFNEIVEYSGVRVYYLIAPAELLKPIESSLIQALKPSLNIHNVEPIKTKTAAKTLPQVSVETHQVFMVCMETIDKLREEVKLYRERSRRYSDECNRLRDQQYKPKLEELGWFGTVDDFLAHAKAWSQKQRSQND